MIFLTEKRGVLTPKISPPIRQRNDRGATTAKTIWKLYHRVSKLLIRSRAPGERARACVVRANVRRQEVTFLQRTVHVAGSFRVYGFIAQRQPSNGTWCNKLEWDVTVSRAFFQLIFHYGTRYTFVYREICIRFLYNFRETPRKYDWHNPHIVYFVEN